MMTEFSILGEQSL